MCGKFGQQEAGQGVAKAAKSGPDMSALATAMLAKGARRLRDLERGRKPVLGRCSRQASVDEIMRHRIFICSGGVWEIDIGN